MIVFAIMNGAMGFRRRDRSRRTYMSDIVQQIAQEQEEKCIFQVERGSLFHWATDRMENSIRGYNTEGNTLIMVGKSQGAENLAKVITHINHRSKLYYDKVHFISIDMNWGPFPTNKNRKTVPIKGVDTLFNIYQVNRLGGVRLKAEKTCQFKQIVLTDDNIDHWKIETNSIWQVYLRELLRSSCQFTRYLFFGFALISHTLT